MVSVKLTQRIQGERKPSWAKSDQFKISASPAQTHVVPPSPPLLSLAARENQQRKFHKRKCKQMKKILRVIIGSLEKKYGSSERDVLCKALIFISIRLLFMAATSLRKQMLVKVSIIFPESSHTLFYSIGCISIIYRESSNVLFSSNVYHSNAFGIPYKLRTEERQNLDSLTLTGS